MKLVTFEMRMTYVVADGEREPMQAAVDAAENAVKALPNTLLCRTGYGIPRGGSIEVELREVGNLDRLQDDEHDDNVEAKLLLRLERAGLLPSADDARKVLDA